MPSLKLPLLGALVSLANLVAADTCTTVAETTTIEVSTPLKLSYISEQTEYWSTACSALKPSCIIFPKDTSELAHVIAILNDNAEQFAIKSGGHSPNVNFASVQDGPLISTQKLDHIQIDQATGLVRAGPGNRQDRIAKFLEGTGWVVAGGRVGNVGLGGLVQGGGMSYFSAKVGWTASTVVEYELVLPNATVTKVSAQSDPELFRALKGGGNNFGVVSSYTFQAQPQPPKVWGGNLAFLRTPATDKTLLQAVRDFTEHNTDPKAAVIVTAERVVVGAVDLWVLFLYYDDEAPPEDESGNNPFSNFTSAHPVVNSCRTRTHADMMAWSNWVVLPGSIVTVGTETIPLPSAANFDVLESIHAYWREMSNTVLAVPGLLTSIAFQPVPRAIAANAKKARGGDLIDLDDDVDRMVLEINYSYTFQASREKMEAKLEETYKGVKEIVEKAQAEDKLPRDVYLPIFMNYGFSKQDYFGRLKQESRALAKRVAERVDPTGLFRKRTGGWKP